MSLTYTSLLDSHGVLELGNGFESLRTFALWLQWGMDNQAHLAMLKESEQLYAPSPRSKSIAVTICGFGRADQKWAVMEGMVRGHSFGFWYSALCALTI